jgi:hypothetical protein
MTVRAAILLAAALAACAQPPDPAYRVVGRHGPMVYVVMGQAMPREAGAWAAAVREACGDAHICNVKIWTDPARAARGFPMTDLEVEAIQAAYLINRSTGANEFICHPFGSAGQNC